MANRLTKVLHCLRRLTDPPETASDADLLRLFAHTHDEDAFSTLVARHGAMVLNVCRRVLGDAHAAEDAFQATFLVLARRAHAIGRPEALAGWLYGVASRVASKARGGRRGRQQEMRELIDPQPGPLAELTARECLHAIEEELQRLPEAQRLPVVLCCLEGLSQEEVARRLGWTAGSVKGRLERGRALLHSRLTRRGLTLSAALGIAELARNTATASEMATATAKQAVLFASKQTLPAGTVAAGVVTLAQGVLNTMFLSKFKSMLAGGLLLLTLGTGAYLFGGNVPTPEVEKPKAETVATAPGIVKESALAATWVERIRLPLADIGEIDQLTLSPESKYLAVVVRPRDGKTTVFDTTSGKTLFTIASRHDGDGEFVGVRQAEYSPDGKMLAIIERTSGPELTDGGKTRASFYEASSGKLLYSLDEKARHLEKIAFSPDGKMLATGGIERFIHLWDLTDRKLIAKLEVNAEETKALAFSPDGKLLASAGGNYLGKEEYQEDGELILWNLITRKRLKVIDRLPDFTALAFSPDSKVVATGSTDSLVRTWDCATGGLLRKFQGHKGSICAVAFSADGSVLVSAGSQYDNGAILWNAETGEKKSTLRGTTTGQKMATFDMALARDGKLLATGHQLARRTLPPTASGAGPRGVGTANPKTKQEVILWEMEKK